MNNYQSSKGRDIVPSARKPIHSQKHCPSASSINMGGYGLNTHKNRGERLDAIQPAKNDEAIAKGKDEVDNILSKHSSVQDHEYQGRKIINYLRRNSYDVNYIQEDSSDSNDSGEWALDNHSKKSFNSTGNTSTQSGNLTSRYISNQLNQTPSELQTQGEGWKHSSSTKSVLWAPFVIAIIGIIVTYTQILGTKEITVYDESKFYNDINNLGGKYRLSQDSLLQVQTGISIISEREDTGSFIFVYNSKSQNFNHQLFDDVLDSISHTAAKFLRNDSTTVRHLVVESSDLNMRTTSELINKYREDVTRTGVMLIKEIDRIPSSLAMAFHYYCDEYNPLVKKSAIFFTMDLTKCQNNSESSIHSLIEKCLTNKWNSVPPENIKPLLTRVVSIVVDLTR